MTPHTSTTANDARNKHRLQSLLAYELSSTTCCFGKKFLGRRLGLAVLPRSLQKQTTPPVDKSLYPRSALFNLTPASRAGILGANKEQFKQSTTLSNGATDLSVNRGAASEDAPAPTTSTQPTPKEMETKFK